MSENSIPESFKMTELGLLPEEWGVVKLGDIANFKNGINFTRDQKGKSGILTIDVFNMYSEGIYVNPTNLYRVNKQINDDYLLRNGDILFVRSSLKREGVGWTSLFRETQEQVTFCGFVIRARLKSNNISPEFLTNYLRTNNARENLIASSGKVAITNINQGMLGRVTVPLPPLPEQQKIAEVLSTVQEAKEKTDAVISATNELKKSLMRHLFTYGPVPVKKFNEFDELGVNELQNAQNSKNSSNSSNSSNSIKLKETEIGLVPEEWAVKPLIDIATLQRGKDLPKQKQIPGTFPIVGSSGILGYHNEPVCAGPGVVTGRSGSIGKLTFVEEDYWPHNTGLYVKDFHGNIPKFVYYLLHLFDFKKYATGVSVPTLNRNFVHSVLLPCPPLPIQQKIAVILSSVDQKIQVEEYKKQALAELFKALLNNLMTAKVRVNHLEEML